MDKNTKLDISETGLCKASTRGLGYSLNFVKNNLVHYSVLFNFGHIRRWDQCAVFILYSLIFAI